MEEVNITETESRYFGDLFLCCDIEKSGKVPILKATEMFRSANLSNDVIRQITSVSGIPQTAIHMSRVQFYSCLKLIAAHQAAVPLRPELISSTISLPLPKFSWKDSPTKSIEGNHSIISSDLSNGRDDSIQWHKSSRSPNLIHLTTAREGTHTNDLHNNSDITSTDSEVEHNDTDGAKDRHRRKTGGSPEAWSTASDSPTPTNSVTERPWAKATLWQGLFCEEQRQLLGTEEESSDRHSSDEDNDVDLETVYQITPEQREYYLTQFRAVQPDQNGLLSGTIARVFFEKSRIPVEELRHIWQLCDVTRDGALSLDEFTAAMHLVVLRRNNIPLPAILPACLMPSGIVHTSVIPGPAEADLLHLDDDATEPPTIPNENEYKRMISVHDPNEAKSAPSNREKISNHHSSHQSSASPISSTASSATAQTNRNRSLSNTPPTQQQQSSNHSIGNVVPTVAEPLSPPKLSKDAADWISQNKEWTKFTESPTSNVSSPGPKPVNFDMQRTAQAVVSDPLILHPVPLRVTPIGVDNHLVGDDETSRISNRKSDAIVFDHINGIITAIRDSEASPKQMNVSNTHRDSLQNNDLRAIQRPQPKKLPHKNAGAIPPPPQREPSVGSNETTLDSSTAAPPPPPPPLSAKKEAPPLPPPRPHKHARSSSLDLNKLKFNAPPTPPEVPPRTSPQIVSQVSLDVGDSSSFADFAHFPDTNNEHQSTNLSAKLATTNRLDSSSRHTILSLQSSLRSSAFEVYRKPTTPKGFNSPESQQSRSMISDYEKRVSMLNESLRHVTFKEEQNLNDVVHRLKEQNILLLRLCSDLTEELSTVQRKKEELKSKYDLVTGGSGGGSSSSHHSIV